MKSNSLITFASWEDRFRIGFDRNLEKVCARKALVYYFRSYKERTRDNRDDIEKKCKAKKIEYISAELDIGNPAKNWQTAIDSIDGIVADCNDIWIDISTMPREIIWYVLWMLEHSNVKAQYVYHSPEKYGDDWLSREPRSPRLVYKMSGIASPSAKTALIVTVGYDLQRVKRLLNWFEPSTSMIGVQSGSQFPQSDQIMAEYEILESEYNCEIFELDAFAGDFGMKIIRKKLDSFDSSYNVIMGSLGPKLTAVTLFKLQRERNEVGLVYAPSNQFNPDYSSGIGKCFEGRI